jgi:release factor glutamine methyltransferase
VVRRSSSNGDGFSPTAVARAEESFGPVMRARAAQLRDQGLLAPGQHDELVVIRADRLLNRR